MPKPANTSADGRCRGGMWTEATAMIAVNHAIKWVTTEIVFGWTLRRDASATAGGTCRSMMRCSIGELGAATMSSRAAICEASSRILMLSSGGIDWLGDLNLSWP